LPLEPASAATWAQTQELKNTQVIDMGNARQRKILFNIMKKALLAGHRGG
jgi:hypothetical protein